MRSMYRKSNRLKPGINDLYTVRPDIAAEWLYEKNGELRPEDLTSMSNHKVWWQCPAGHEYQCSVDQRVGKGQNCPFCSGKQILSGFNDLLTLNPKLAAEWDYSKNTDLLPNQIALHSNKSIWWKCRTCGNEWKTKVNDRANGKGCPRCSRKKQVETRRENYTHVGKNDLKTQAPELCKEWNYDKNGELKPEQFTCGSAVKVWWQCSVCGYEWQALINSRVRKRGCPKCSKYRRTSFPEQALLYYLKKIYPGVTNSYSDIFPKSSMELDIYIPEIKTGIEYDGKAWHTGEENQDREKRKYTICRENGIHLLRVSESYSEGKEQVCDEIVYRVDLTETGLDEAIRTVLKKLSIISISVNCEQDRSSIMKQYITVIQEKSIAVRFPEAVSAWDTEKNGGITPDMVNARTNKKYWWKCELGHSYKAEPANKLWQSHGCPICSGHQILPGFNDLKTRYPEIAREWDIGKNTPKHAYDVMPGSQQKFWWLCEKGHSYLATPNSRTANRTGCPICAGKVVLSGFNDLLTTSPKTAGKWDKAKNGNLNPEQVTAHSNQIVWWSCDLGHSWKKSVCRQVNNDFCPVCDARLLVPGVNDLGTTHPKLSEEWDQDKNGNLTPRDVMRTSAQKVWWKCRTCGNEWMASVRTRINKDSGCPICGYTHKMQNTRAYNTHFQGKDLVSRFPDIAKEWDYERNVGLDPNYLSSGSNHKVWWTCPNGHHYQAWMNDRTGKRKTGCPYCSGKRKMDKISVSTDILGDSGD